MINVTTCLRLEVETPPPAGKTKSLVKNPDGALGGWFWVTPTGGSVDRSITLPGFLRYTHDTGGTGLRTERMPVTAGRYVSARWKGSHSGAVTVTATVVFEDTNGAVVATTAASPAYASAPTTERLYGPHLAPANTVSARLVFTPSGIAGGQVVELSEVGFVARAASGAVTWATDVVYGPTWLDVLGPTIEIEIERAALDLGMLSAVIRDATLDPAVATTIRPGRECRVTALHATTGTWEALFVGEVSDFDVAYEADALARKPGDPKHCKITLTATDRTRTLASVKRPSGVAGALYDLRSTLEEAGVPFAIDGNTGTLAQAPTVVSHNENASALDQIAITRDSLGAHAWLDRRGVLQVVSQANMAGLVNTGLEVDTAQWSGVNATIARVTTPTASGAGALQVTATATSSVNVRPIRIRITPGHPYTVTVKTRAATVGRGSRVVLNWRTSNNGNVGTTIGATTVNTTSGWTTHTVTVAPSAIPVDAVYVFATVDFLSPAVGEVFYVDDLTGYGADVVLDQARWTAIGIGGSSRACINEVSIDFLRLTYDADGTPKTETIPYGPYRHEASIAEFGVRPRKFTIHGTNETANVGTVAAAVLAANATPKVSATSVTVPVKSTADLVMTHALADLQQAAVVSFASKGYSEALRITGIRHVIRADAKHKARWIITYTFEGTNTVAVPRAAPTLTQTVEPPDPWIPLPLIGGWVPFSALADHQPHYRKIDGVVFLRGIIKPTTSWTSVCANMPPGYRPAVDRTHRSRSECIGTNAITQLAVNHVNGDVFHPTATGTVGGAAVQGLCIDTSWPADA